MDISYLALAPDAILIIGALIVLTVDISVAPSSRVHAGIVSATLLAHLVSVFLQWDDVVANGGQTSFDGFLRMDRAAVVTRFIMFVVTAFGLVGSWEMMQRLGRRMAEGVVLVLIAAAGFSLMAASGDLMMMFVGLEIGSISLYILAGISREKAMADEAAVKYFLLGAFASAIFVYGAALSFAGAGSTQLQEIGLYLQGVVLTRPGVILVAIALLIVGLAFKVTAAPFHAWAPDVYQGSPAGVVGFMAAAAKVGAFAALSRVLLVAFPKYEHIWGMGLAVIAAISVVIGSLMAIQQTDLRRMLAYSGVAHAGFILTGVAAGGAGVDAVWFYLATYTVQLIAAFTITAQLTGPTSSGASMDSLRGLGAREPLLAGSLAVVMLAMSGLPLTAGFVGKFGVFAAAWDAGYAWLVVIGLLASVAGFFFYLRTIVLMYFESTPVVADAPGTARASAATSVPIRAVLILAVLVTIFFGFFPGPLLEQVARAFPF